MSITSSPAGTLPVLNEQELIACLAAQPDIAAAYLFGSMAQGKAMPHSDVDIAILLTASNDEKRFFTRRLELLVLMEPYANREMDVIVLNEASLLLRHEVLLHGRRLFQGNRRERVEFEVRTHQLYNDARPMLDFFNRDLLKRIREGRFGRRTR
jgi:predicted nucleotidyltransferase